MILELVAGAFGWGWMVAGGFAIYYLVMAIGFDGDWVSFVVALVISGVAKWLARGFEDSKQRVAFEADMVAKGMSPEEAGKAWLKANTGQEVPETPAAATPAPTMTEENRHKAEERAQIVADYGTFLERNPTGTDIWDVQSLPHDKEAILNAICLEIVREENNERVEALKACALCLANFQEGVGDKPLSQLGVDLTSFDPTSMSDEDTRRLARQIAGNPDHSRFEALQRLVQQDQQKILARLIASEKMRREMPEEKKREILG